MDDDRIRDYFESPQHRGDLENATHTLTRRIPTCGDEVTLRLRIDAGVITHARFHACGCVISQAAAAMLCEHVEGQSTQTLATMLPTAMLALIGIPLTPRRVQCGLLPFRTLKEIVYGAEAT